MDELASPSEPTLCGRTYPNFQLVHSYWCPREHGMIAASILLWLVATLVATRDLWLTYSDSPMSLIFSRGVDTCPV
jgi:hypothetical protein